MRRSTLRVPCDAKPGRAFRQSIRFCLRTIFSLPGEGIAVTLAVRKEGKDQRLRGGGDEFFSEHNIIMHSSVVYGKSKIQTLQES